jgi:hypothetical protein
MYHERFRQTVRELVGRLVSKHRRAPFTLARMSNISRSEIGKPVALGQSQDDRLPVHRE